MPFGDFYRTGTASTDPESPADLTKIIGHGTLWTVTVVAGDTFEQSGARCTILEVVSDTELTLAYDWPGDPFSAAPYLIRFDSGLRHEPTEMVARVRELLETLKIFDSAAPIITVQYFGDTAPPVGAIIGDRGVVAVAGATGEFTGKEGQIWLKQDTGYQFTGPQAGWQVFVDADLLPYFFDGTTWRRPTAPYHLPIWIAGKPSGSEVIFEMSMPQEVLFLEGMPGSIGRSVGPATAESIFSIQKNGLEFATATFAIGSTEPVFDSDESVQFSPGDVLSVVAPDERDTSPENTNLSLVGKL